MTRKRMSPATKHKLQLILIYLAAIVFCILWLSDAIAINKRIKYDNMQISASAKRAQLSLHLYLSSDDNKVFWNESIAYMLQFSAIYNEKEFMFGNKKFRKDSSKRYSVGTYLDGIADTMLLEPDTVMPYLGDISREIDNFCVYLDNGDTEYAEHAEEELGKILDEIRGVTR